MADNFARFGARTLVNFIPLKGRFGAKLEELFDKDEDGNLISRSGNLPVIFETTDEEGAPVIFIDNGMGGYDVVNKNKAALEDSKNIDIFMNELDNENKRRTDRSGLPRTLNFWGEQAVADDPVGGDWAVTYSPLKGRDMPYNRQDLLDSFLFSEEDLDKSLPFMFGNERADSIANSRKSEDLVMMKQMINTVGVFGEFERLGWFPRRHPNYISLQGNKIPLSSEQYNDYISMINGDFSVLSEEMMDEVPGQVSTEYYNFIISGRTLKGDLRNLMSSEKYHMLGNDDLDTNTLTSRVYGTDMVEDVISFARHGNRISQTNSLGDTNRPITLDGPEKLLLIKYPDLKQKVQYVEDIANKKDVKPYKRALEEMEAE